MLFVKLNRLCVRTVEEHLKGELRPLGFRPEGPHAFRKDVGDVRWYISVSTHPKSPPGEADVFVEACAFSGPLARKVGRRYASNWYASQVRVTFQRLAGLPRDPYQTDAWHCKSEADAHEASKEVIQILHEHVLPFLQQIQSTDDLVEFMLKGGYTLSTSKANKFEAGVWRGEVDPSAAHPGAVPYVTVEVGSTEELVALIKKQMAEEEGRP